MKKRMLAEWENPKAIMLAYPNRNSDWAYILEEARSQYDYIIDALIKGKEYVWLLAGREDIDGELKGKIEDNEGKVIDDVSYNDTWTRDYGPITVERNLSDNNHIQKEELDFGFNGWGLKFAADNDNLVNLRMALKGYVNPDQYKNHRDFILEGGSIETDGKGTILTTARCLCSPNRNGGKDKEEIEAELNKRIGAKKVLWLDYGYLEGDDTDSHVDTLARMAPEDTIIYVAPPEDPKDVHYQELKKMEEQLKNFRTAEGKPFRLIPLPFPTPIHDEDGNRLPATYANYLVTGWNLYMPTYGQPNNDTKAREAIQKAFPNHMIYEVECLTLIKQHGSLHCSTMQIYSF